MMGPDVGGSRFVNDLQLEARGADARHTTVMQDGMSLDNIALDGIPVLYNQDLATEEMAVQAGGGGGTAEVQSGGVVLTLIPKEGGNVFSGQGYAGYTAGGWMADNTTPQLKALGVNIGELDQIYDYSKIDRRADRPGQVVVPQLVPVVGGMDARAGSPLQRRQRVHQRGRHHRQRHPADRAADPTEPVQRLPRSARQAARACRPGGVPGVSPAGTQGPRPGDGHQLPQQGAGLASRAVLAGAGEVDVDREQPVALSLIS